MKVVLIGTGATIGTLGLDGGIRQFPARLAAVHPSWRTDYPELARLISDCGDDGDRLDHIWTRIDYYSKLHRILGTDYGPTAAIQLRKAVLEAYSLKGEINEALRAKTSFTLKTVLATLAPGDALVSFNWDTLAETVAVKLLGIDLVQAPYPDQDRHVRFLKPHGSLSWEHRSDGSDGTVVMAMGSAPALEPMDLKSVHASGGFSQPLVLGAVPIKSELLGEIQFGQGNLHALISEQWRATLEALSLATDIVVCGYGFPSEDAYGRFLFKEAVRKRPRALPEPTIRYYALSSDRHAMEAALRDIWGPLMNYTYDGEVSPCR